MDTDNIRLFVISAETLNISAAGRQLGFAPAVASARLAKLEHQLGADLFHRSTRKVSLSLEGQEFLPYAKEMLAQENAALAVLGRGNSEVSGVLRLAASSTFTQLHIAPLLPEFLQRYPGLRLDLRLSDTQENLIEGGYDLALRNYAIKDSSLRARKLAHDKRILCASPTYLAQQGTPQTPDDLTKHQLLLFKDNHMLPLTAEGQPSATYPPAGCKGRVILDDGASMRAATVAGVGISMNAYWSVYQALQQGTLVRVLPDYIIDDQAAIWLVYPKSNVLTAKVRVFIDFLLEKVGDPPLWER